MGSEVEALKELRSYMEGRTQEITKSNLQTGELREKAKSIASSLSENQSRQKQIRQRRDFAGDSMLRLES